MNARACIAHSFVAFVFFSTPPTTRACCPAPRSGQLVVNADQTAIIIWDAAAKTQHFIRRASFKSEADDFGFLIPTPTQPELAEAGDAAFPFLMKLTEPETTRIERNDRFGCGCGGVLKSGSSGAVTVLDEKLVAGFDAAVLETESANALVAWLKDRGYAYSPEIEAWAKPYVDAGWKFTALKVAKAKDGEQEQRVAASALRLSFKTDRPLFPYREPDTKAHAAALGAKLRKLRIYFIAESRYAGEMENKGQWTGQVAWSNRLGDEQRKELVQVLGLPATTGPGQWWLTEFEDDWPYKIAAGDVYFAKSSDQDTMKRPPVTEYVSSTRLGDELFGALAVIAAGSATCRFGRRTRP